MGIGSATSDREGGLVTTVEEDYQEAASFRLGTRMEISCISYIIGASPEVAWTTIQSYSPYFALLLGSVLTQVLLDRLGWVYGVLLSALIAVERVHLRMH